MVDKDNDRPAAASKAIVGLDQLRQRLVDVRDASNGERIHPALIDVLDALITHVEKQDRMMEALASDLTHKQGIVTTIGKKT